MLYTVTLNQIEPDWMKDIQGNETILRETEEDLNKWRNA